MSSCREQTNTDVLGRPYPRPVPAPTSHLATYPQGLQVRDVFLGAEKHVVGHAEALTYPKMVEQGRLCQGAAHLQHHHVCEHKVEALSPEPSLEGKEAGAPSWLSLPSCVIPAGSNFAPGFRFLLLGSFWFLHRGGEAGHQPRAYSRPFEKQELSLTLSPLPWVRNPVS